MAVQSYIDGVDVTSVVQSGSSTRKLNGIAHAEIDIFTESAIGGVGSKLKIVESGVLRHHGRVLHVSDDAGEDATGLSKYSSSDPMELWQWRPARDPDGDFSDPDFFKDPGFGKYGPRIMQTILAASVDTTAGGGGPPPGAAEGSLFVSLGGFASGGVDLSGAPTNFPMTIAEVAALLTSTGEVDIILTPIDSGGNMAQVDCYNGNYGNDLSGSVVWQYATGSHNVRRVRRTQDMSNLMNKLYYYLGTRYPPQHWDFNITGDDPGLPDPPQSSLLSARDASRTAYGVRMEIQIFDTQEESEDIARELLRRQWQAESWLRQQPRQLVHVTPIRGSGVGSFDIGDLVSVAAGTKVRGGFSGVQRVYEWTFSWDEDGVVELAELVTSANQEGL